MPRPRTILISAAAVLAGAATSGIGVAQADSSSTAATTTPSTIIVNGTDSITIDPSSSDATIAATYQTALGDAITNADQKATFIATQIKATLGAITNVTETSDSSDLCNGPILAEGVATPEVAKSTTPKSKTTTTSHKKHKSMIVRAIVDPTSSCSVEADVTVTYDITPA